MNQNTIELFFIKNANFVQKENENVLKHVQALFNQVRTYPCTNMKQKLVRSTSKEKTLQSVTFVFEINRSHIFICKQERLIEFI